MKMKVRRLAWFVRWGWRTVKCSHCDDGMWDVYKAGGGPAGYQLPCPYCRGASRVRP